MCQPTSASQMDPEVAKSAGKYVQYALRAATGSDELYEEFVHKLNIQNKPIEAGLAEAIQPYIMR